MNRENLHLAILQELASNPTRFGVPESVLKVRVRVNQAVKCDDTQWEAGLQYVEGAGFIESVGKPLNPENRNWKITKAGTDFLAERGYL